MTLQTASEGISFARELEEVSAEHYQRLAERFGDKAETFRAYAAANKKNILDIERAYYGVITDAIEGGFAFEIEPEDYALDFDPAGLADYWTALAQALQNEGTIVRYYTDAAAQSEGTMADIPRAFMRVAKKRGRRIEQLNNWFHNETPAA